MKRKNIFDLLFFNKFVTYFFFLIEILRKLEIRGLCDSRFLRKLFLEIDWYMFLKQHFKIKTELISYTFVFIWAISSVDIRTTKTLQNGRKLSIHQKEQRNGGEGRKIDLAMETWTKVASQPRVRQWTNDATRAAWLARKTSGCSRSGKQAPKLIWQEALLRKPLCEDMRVQLRRVSYKNCNANRWSLYSMDATPSNSYGASVISKLDKFLFQTKLYIQVIVFFFFSISVN